MKVNNHYLYGKKDSPYFISYLIDDYQEYQTGRKRPAVIICPGGGYLKLSEREGEPIALTFLQKGYHAFVLRYQIGTMDGEVNDVSRQALLELAMTIKMIHENEDQWLVDMSSLIVLGFSAGAHLAAMFGNEWSEPWIADKLGISGDILRIKAVVLCYPLCDIHIMMDSIKNDKETNTNLNEFLEQSLIAICGEKYPDEKKSERYSPVCLVNAQTPPTFIWHTANDEMVSSDNSLRYALQLSHYHIPYELHIFEQGVHGMALANEFTACRQEEINIPCQKWVPLLFTWLDKKIKSYQIELNNEHI